VTESRFDTLRKMIGAVGERQIEHHKFFPPFADQLVTDLGQYLGDPSSVALCPARGDFDFGVNYRHEGLGFDGGRYSSTVVVSLRTTFSPLPKRNDEAALVGTPRVSCTSVQRSTAGVSVTGRGSGSKAL
jgi:hypothetical protein